MITEASNFWRYSVAGFNAHAGKKYIKDYITVQCCITVLCAAKTGSFIALMSCNVENATLHFIIIISVPRRSNSATWFSQVLAAGATAGHPNTGLSANHLAQVDVVYPVIDETGGYKNIGKHTAHTFLSVSYPK